MIQKYRAYLSVIHTGSITKAAKQLGYTQSAVSRMIAQLEEEWDLPLLLRNRGNLSPTSDGLALLEELRSICQSQETLEEKIHRLHKAEAGFVRIGAFSSVSASFLPHILGKFQKAFPQISFQLFHGEYAQIREWLRQGIIDCGFLPLPAEADLEIHPLLQDRLVAVLPMDHPMAKEQTFPLSAFGGQILLQPVEERDQEIRRILAQLPLAQAMIHAVSDDHAILSMTEAGLGISLLHELVADTSRFRVAAVPIHPASVRTIGIAIKKNAPVSKGTEAFLSHLSHCQLS
ncbi:LysR family transcriptional regulator [Anaerotignum lactatifermentans]|uniref:LysR family transcriptional regulator n=1 Tax=Anaerotignum lactatifermentans TaxID=160404 RepID=A0ABS2G9E2_9FIRM|nr:LysR family transcriptional regulator [Anaerotignum lactatifermentans]MBM6828370.1 LysR family transcriptional regulator [Anaerotignum lactatifermentans]MBM6877650.1 LysR family transcriptional regulator [Anaerotignum lactatifermentans]MBM6949953.1 LysR family transcriptional regulator [Anaerotignum lactatifermentans]